MPASTLAATRNGSDCTQAYEKEGVPRRLMCGCYVDAMDALVGYSVGFAVFHYIDMNTTLIACYFFYHRLE